MFGSVSQMKKKVSHPVDVHVGGRVRARRVLLKMSQEKLGEKLGLTFQQVQKYEKGYNRIGASRLWLISKVLGVPVSYFYEDLVGGLGAGNGFAESPEGNYDYVNRFTQSSEGLRLMRAFMQIEDSSLRRSIVQFVCAIAASRLIQGEEHPVEKPPE